MGEIITYCKDDAIGIFCQIKLDNGERILISLAQNEVGIFELGSDGLIPINTIWKSNDVSHMIELFEDDDMPSRHPLDCVKDKLIDCDSIEDVKKILFRER